LAVSVLPKEFWKTHSGAGLHCGMNEKLNAMLRPHSPLPLAHMRNENQLEIDPVRIDAIIDAFVGLNPVAIDVSGIRSLGAKTTIDIDIRDPGHPKRFDGGTESLQQPPTPGRETKALRDLLQRCLMISRRQCTGRWIKRRYQAAPIISETKAIVNITVVVGTGHQQLLSSRAFAFKSPITSVIEGAP
jgi:hypothetical protein